MTTMPLSETTSFAAGLKDSGSLAGAVGISEPDYVRKFARWNLCADEFVPAFTVTASGNLNAEATEFVPGLTEFGQIAAEWQSLAEASGEIVSADEFTPETTWVHTVQVDSNVFAINPAFLSDDSDDEDIADSSGTDAKWQTSCMSFGKGLNSDAEEFVPALLGSIAADTDSNDLTTIVEPIPIQDSEHDSAACVCDNAKIGSAIDLLEHVFKNGSNGKEQEGDDSDRDTCINESIRSCQSDKDVDSGSDSDARGCSVAEASRTGASSDSEPEPAAKLPLVPFGPPGLSAPPWRAKPRAALQPETEYVSAKVPLGRSSPRKKAPRAATLPPPQLALLKEPPGLSLPPWRRPKAAEQNAPEVVSLYARLGLGLPPWRTQTRARQDSVQGDASPSLALQDLQTAADDATEEPRNDPSAKLPPWRRGTTGLATSGSEGGRLASGGRRPWRLAPWSRRGLVDDLGVLTAED